MSHLRWMLAAALACGAVPALAETLTITGANPAGSPNVNDLVSIAVERFEGEDGSLLSQALESELTEVRFAGQPYFRVVAPEAGVPTDALVTGNVRVAVDETGTTEKRKRCLEQDSADKNKCLKEEEYDLRCRRRVATVSTNVRLVAMGDGSVRYTRPLSARDELVYCPDRKATRTVDAFVDTTLMGQVGTIRRDFAPSGFSEDVRVDENRKGLPKPAAEAFKNAIRQTKSDEAGACDSWAAIAREVEPTAALAFNMGLCAEARRDFAAAVDWYGQAQRLGSKNRDIGEGLARIDRHRRALADWDARQAFLRER
ncbi:hypothetical protein [Sphingopyxis sp. KK2]|uniref:hypothetical protein n=1 Tax=Sphingopyxis sp. KK2 TaxID=1855727 RepID=UPI001181861E|nr:hypothetical protein [Sphingopyxis sp. KK2]